ncbi:Phospho-2-dehydro-3-deoxyheptonate aldolase, Phe-sensitive [Rhizobium tibeticum]|uniref:3-deoxy-7-phosphoheptulonate synthase n=2 Tax=Rhizobium tibeticum TaxID=501024 RepID=A0A1K0K8K0_9HYPH|nr:Phospho-2-dehydro-3-deoxyheptonate aldolase, Phe-sensitive [Rhizobium tibeticum]
MAASIEAKLDPRIMIDASHANSRKNPENQPAVLQDVAQQLADGNHAIIGSMVESNIVGGRQDLIPGKQLVYGQSVTDGCIDWPTTVETLDTLASGVKARRATNKAKA